MSMGLPQHSPHLFSHLSYLWALPAWVAWQSWHAEFALKDIKMQLERVRETLPAASQLGDAKCREVKSKADVRWVEYSC